MKSLFVVSIIAVSFFGHNLRADVVPGGGTGDVGSCIQDAQLVLKFASLFDSKGDKSRIIYVDDDSFLPELEKTAETAEEYVAKKWACGGLQAAHSHLNTLSICTTSAMLLVRDSIEFSSKKIQKEYYEIIRKVRDSYGSKTSDGFMCSIDDVELTKNRIKK